MTTKTQKIENLRTKTEKGSGHRAVSTVMGVVLSADEAQERLTADWTTVK